MQISHLASRGPILSHCVLCSRLFAQGECGGVEIQSRVTNFELGEI